MTGIITKSTGSWYHILSDNIVYKARLIGKFKHEDKQLTNPIAVGDQVEFNLENGEEQNGVITKILPRKNYVIRQSPRKKHQLHVIASNLDQVLLIITFKEPNLKVGFIDRFLLMTEPFNIPTIIVFNKSDILTENDKSELNEIIKIYQDIGYKTIQTSSINGQGIDELQKALINKITLISGQSGVGKSTLVTSIEPTLDIKTEEISEFSGKGQHTTTFAEMHPLTFGGHIIDTPGIKTLSFSHLEVQDVAHNFKEFFTLSHNCKFGNCTHQNEPKCAVKEALEQGKVSLYRYQNYLTIIEEIEDQNYWERHSNI